jgi:5-methylcytosine-specific restriction endonuclease McrA
LEVPLAKDGFKACSHCKETFPVSFFRRNRCQADGLANQCKACLKQACAESRQHDPTASREAAKRWREKDPERHKARLKKWRAENQDAVKANGVLRRVIRLEAPGRGVPGNVWEQIVTAWAGTCAYCSDAPATEQDHIVPLSRGGAHDVLNVVPACKPCNMQKGGSSVEEWATFDLQLLAQLVHDVATKLDFGIRGSCRPNASLPTAGSYIALSGTPALKMPPTQATLAERGVKHCWKCKESKPLAEFGKLTRSADGLHDRCKACNVAILYARPKIPTPAEKRCSRCKETRAIADFGNNAASPDGKHHYCVPCTKARRVP